MLELTYEEIDRDGNPICQSQYKQENIKTNKDMTNVFTCLMKKKFGNGNGSGMDRDFIGNGSARMGLHNRALAAKTSRKLFALLFCILFVGVGNVWGTASVSVSSSTVIFPASSTTVANGAWKSACKESQGYWSGDKTFGSLGSLNFTDAGDNNNDYKCQIKAGTGVITTTITSSYGVDVTVSAKGKDASGKEITISITTSSGSDTKTCTATSFTDFTVSTTLTSATLTISNTGTQVGGIQYIQITPKSAAVSSIALKTSATKTAYVAGENFAPAGLVITATYSDASTEDIDYDTHSGDFSFSPSTGLTAGTTSTTVTYATKTCSQSINVYSVTLQVQDEDGNAIGVGGPGSPTRTGASITPAADAANYAWKKWLISNATLGSAAATKGNTITNPTDAVTVTAVYNKPRTVTWMVNGAEYTPHDPDSDPDDGLVNGTAVVKHGSAWSTLTLPTDPDPGDYCGAKFMGWTTTNIGATGLDKTDDADDIAALVLMTSANKASMTGAGKNINSNITFYAVFADYAE